MASPSRSSTPRSPGTKSFRPAAILELADRLYDYQLDLIFSDEPELAVVSTPQIGKTEAVANWCVKQAVELPLSTGWWTAPTYSQVMDGFNAVRSVLQYANVPHRPTQSIPPRIYVTDVRSVIEFRSWRKVENLSGRTVHYLVGDEAHGLTLPVRMAFEERMLATLGPRRYIGNATVEGSEWEKLCIELERRGRFRHWTWEHRYRALLAKGLDREAAAYFANQERCKAEWIPSEYDRVFGARWVVEQETILGPYVKTVFVNPWSSVPHEGHDYIIPVDVGLVDDYTVAMPLCTRCMSASWYYRERGDSAAPAPGSLGGDTLEDRLAVIGRHWNNGQIVIERNNGQKLLDDVAKVYPRVDGWWTDEKTKRNGVLEWVKLARTGGLTLPAEETMMREHRRFRSLRSPTGVWRFSAPSGEHDDTVMSGLIGVAALLTGPAAYLRMLERRIDEQARKKEGPRAA